MYTPVTFCATHFQNEEYTCTPEYLTFPVTRVKTICYSLDTSFLHKRFAYCIGNTLVSESFQVRKKMLCCLICKVFKPMNTRSVMNGLLEWMAISLTRSLHQSDVNFWSLITSLISA